MVKFYILQDNHIVIKTLQAVEANIDKSSIVWVDLFSPSADELKLIAQHYCVEFPTSNEREEIEMSSRYWEDHNSSTINAYFFIAFFFVQTTKKPYNETVTFIVQDNILFTLRYAELKTFDEMEKRILARAKEFMNCLDIMIQIFDIRVDADADILEYATKEINNLRQSLFSENDKFSDDILRKIATAQEFNLRIQETVLDKRRIVTALQKSNKISVSLKEELIVISKDINSLIEFTNINQNSLDNIQNLFLGQVNIEQNKIIKIFTVASVALMPPTLIASVYGMNFHFIPELNWHFGYLYSIGLMLTSAAIPLGYFRKRGWL